MVTSDFLVIGGGIIGINVARQLKRQFSDATVTVIEKENHCGAHASGRNSGVLHAGFYYSPESLKAKFTRLGNKRLTEYCESKQIPMNRCGMLLLIMLIRNASESADMKKKTLSEFFGKRTVKCREIHNTHNRDRCANLYQATRSLSMEKEERLHINNITRVCPMFCSVVK